MDDQVTWFHSDGAVPVSEVERDHFVQEVVSKLRAAPTGDFHYIATGDVLVLGLREQGRVHVKVLQPVRSADFYLENEAVGG